MKDDGPMKVRTGLERLGDMWLRTKVWRERYHLKPLFSVMMYIVVPLLAIFMIMHQYPLLAKERFYRMISWIAPIGTGLFVLSLVQERFKKGTLSRLGLDGLFVAMTMFWLFGFLGGRPIIESTYAGWGFTVDVTPIVVIVLVGTSLNYIRDLLEYHVMKDGLTEVVVSSDDGVVDAEAIADGDFVTLTSPE